MMIIVDSARIEKETKYIIIQGRSLAEIRNSESNRERLDKIPVHTFVFATKDPSDQKYIVKVLKSSKATKESKTYGQAVQAIVGTHLTLNQLYEMPFGY